MASNRMTSAEAAHVGKARRRQHNCHDTVFLMLAQSVLVLFLLADIYECATPKKKTNVLLIVADDLRPQLPVYKRMAKDLGLDPFPTMWTPNIDELAKKSFVLGRAYCQAPVCAPSRASFLTGRRPDSTRVYDKNTYWRSAGGDFTTMPQYFKDNGYLSIGMGKIFHSGVASGRDDDAKSWSVNEYPYYHAGSQDYWVSHKESSYRAVSSTFTRDVSELRDEELGNKAVEIIKEIAPAAEKGTKNFFMAVGFRLPHLPWVMPESYLGYYPEDSIDLPTNPDPPVSMPPVAWYTRPELKQYEDIQDIPRWPGTPGSNLPDDVVRDLRRHYYAAVSYVDNQVGRILKELEDQRLSDNTIVVFMSDHGFFLGEHGLWAKNTIFELALHVPLMIHIPGKTTNMQLSLKLVELVDLFPTLVDLTHLQPLQKCPENATANALTKLCREGSSFAPLIEDPDAPLTWEKSAAFSQVYRSSTDSSCDGTMGYTVRTYQYRYTEWITVDRHSKDPVWNSVQGRELYDHMNDPQENRNLAEDTTMTMRIIKRDLRALLREGWRSKGALPQVDYPWTPNRSTSVCAGSPVLIIVLYLISCRIM